MSISRECSASWPLFALAHFKPFGVSQPLIPERDTYEHVFMTYEFSPFACKIMKNWHAIHECEDEHNVEHLQKHAAETKESSAFIASIAFLELNENGIDIAPSQKSISEQDLKVQQIVLAMYQSNWLKLNPWPSFPTDESPKSQITDINLPNITPEFLKAWKSSIKIQEQIISDRCQNALNPEQQTTFNTPSNVVETESSQSGHLMNINNFPSLPCPSTDQPNIILNQTEKTSTEDLIRSVQQEFLLNRKQTYPFRIIASHFICRFILKDLSERPLKMLMTSPGGTGKTHVVKALWASK